MSLSAVHEDTSWDAFVDLFLNQDFSNLQFLCVRTHWYTTSVAARNESEQTATADEPERC